MKWGKGSSQSLVVKPCPPEVKYLSCGRVSFPQSKQEGCGELVGATLQSQALTEDLGRTASTASHPRVCLCSPLVARIFYKQKQHLVMVSFPLFLYPKPSQFGSRSPRGKCRNSSNQMGLDMSLPVRRATPVVLPVLCGDGESLGFYL